MRLELVNGVYRYVPVADYAPHELPDMERRANRSLDEVRAMRAELAQPATPPAPKRMQLRSFRSVKGGKKR